VPPVIRISRRAAGEEWRINVRDNGIGIEAEFADKVFVIFQRLHARDAYEGTGIGLAIVKKIVEYHGGRIWLDLDVAEGTSIYFTLPLLAGVPVSVPSTRMRSRHDGCDPAGRHTDRGAAGRGRTRATCS
jgi:light-regulated signal transduction histidine kinase (bacteriophytochrome)